MTAIYIVGVGMTPFGRHLDKSLKQLCASAVNEALVDANITRESIEEIHFGNCIQGYMEGQHMIRGHSIFLEQGFGGVPIFNLESGCASGSMAFNQALRGLLSGQTQVAMAVGAEKMVDTDKQKMFEAFNSAWDISRTEWQLGVIASMWEGFEAPAGSTSEKPYSAFMDVYKGEFFNHLRHFDITQEQVAAICAKNHQHSVHNPKAQFQVSYTQEEVLKAPPITFPLTLPMCAPISDGAAAVIVCTEEALDKYKIDKSRAITILGSVVGAGVERAPDDFDRHIVTRISNSLYEKAGVGPSDVDLVELHDATAVGELLETEALGLCAPGEGGAFAEKGETSLGGKVPINTSGGLESRGHPIAATGIAQLHDLTQQLRHEAGPRQVENAHIALQCNVGGFWGVEEASAHVALLAK
ncbi:MAG: thiolase family protein [Pseudomonadales bacterium]|nr:thiolase family protein [Pseudomonadales bacterium]